MTTTIKGQVTRVQNPLNGLRRTPWAARAVAVDGKRLLLTTPTSYAASWPEAMQAAQMRRAELYRDLMDEIHAERTNRRYTQPQEETP